MNRLCLIGILSGLAFLGAAVSARADVTHKVDCDKGQSLGQALSRSEGYAGFVQIILSGRCEESVTIPRDRLRITGEEGATIVGQVRSFGVSNNVTLEFLTITGPGNGLFASGGRVRLLDCIVVENTGIGVRVNDGGVVVIRDSYIAENAGSGILLESAHVDVGRSTVFGNGGDGIWANYMGNVRVWETEILGNDQIGVSLNLHSAMDISGNRIAGNGQMDVYAAQDSGVRVSSADVEIEGAVICGDEESSFLNDVGAYVPYNYCSGF